MASEPYRVLGVSRSAGADLVRRAFHRLVLEHHPDRNPSDPQAAARFRAIVEAYRRITREKGRGWATRPAAAGPRGEYRPGMVGGVRLDYYKPPNLPVRWKRAASTFACAHGRSLPLVASGVLSMLITAVGLASEGGMAL